MKRIGCFVLLLCLVLWSGNTIRGQESVQQVPAAVTSDPPPDPTYPATMAWPDILSQGSKMYSVLYIASGSGPHPTVLMLHGFPGNEKNLDLAYSIRRAGWNVLVPFYRGAWGSGGTFSFTHALEDAQASIDFLRDSENAKKFRIDPARIVLVGHSMGGFVAAYAAAHEPKVFAVALVSPGNLGPGSARQRTNDPQFWERWNDNASRLVGTTAQQLVQEVDSDPAKWNYMNCVSLLKNRSLLVLEADDHNTSDNQELASRLRGAGDAEVTEIHMRTDHPFSDHRIAMQAAIVNWLGTITKPQLASQPPKEQAVDGLSAVRAQSVGLQDETAIKAQLGAYSEARQRGDGPAQATFYTEDAEIWLSTTRKMSRGHAAIEKELGLPSDPTRRFRLEVENISFLNPELAFIDAQYYSSSVDPNGHAFYVMVKRGGKWLIRETRTARFVPSSR